MVMTGRLASTAPPPPPPTYFDSLWVCCESWKRVGHKWVIDFDAATAVSGLLVIDPDLGLPRPHLYASQYVYCGMAHKSYIGDYLVSVSIVQDQIFFYCLNACGITAQGNLINEPECALLPRH